MTFHVMENIGEALQFLRKKTGLNQKELAEKVNVSPITISNLENDKQLPNKETLKKIFNFFGEDNFEIYFTLVDKQNRILQHKPLW